MQKKWTLAILFGVAGFLRLWNLGYSDYQGDEIKALYNSKEASSTKFFLEQRKGPAQFMLTAGLKTLTPDYRNRFLVRLPFALAGFGSIVVFYLLVKSLFNDKMAFYATIFFTTNGFLIAFSRIVQYQSLVIFFGLLAVYLTKKHVDTGKPRLLLLASADLAVSILAHYDGIFFAPVILVLLMGSLRPNQTGGSKTVLKHLFFPAVLFIVLTGAFYIPFALNVAKSTTAYWAGRISGDVSSKISSSRYLFSVYQPIYALHIYTILGAIGFALTSLLIVFKLLPKVVNKFLIISIKSDVFNAAHLPYPLPILLGVFLWFLLPFLALEAVISIPGTHIYTYLIPLVIMMGFAIYHLEISLLKFVRTSSLLLKLPKTVTSVTSRLVTLLGIWSVFCFLALQSYYIYVEHYFEYPWENKRFLLWTLHKPVATYHLSLFGFPYFRHWTETGDFIKLDNRSKYYSTNERTAMPGYYIDLTKDSRRMGYYIYIHHPQKLIDGLSNSRVERHAMENAPVKVFTNNGRAVTEVYLLNEPEQ